MIGATIEIPAAWLDGIAQDTKDKTSAKSALSKALANKISSVAVEDDAILERAMNSMLGRAYRSQINKEEVAKIALQNLVENPSTN